MRFKQDQEESVQIGVLVSVNTFEIAPDTGRIMTGCMKIT